MNFSTDGKNSVELNNLNLKDVVKEVVKEELKPEIDKMKEQSNQHLQEGNMYLNE